MIAAELTGDVYRDRRGRVWVRTWQGWESASEPTVRKDIASIPGLVELVPATDSTVLADVARELVAMQEWQNGLTAHIPDYYEASEGSQESIISEWIEDLMSGDLVRLDRAFARGEWDSEQEESAITVEALIDGADRAYADENHQDLCMCDSWPDACVTGLAVGGWATGATDSAVKFVLARLGVAS